MANVLVTGGTGFIGSHLAEKLIKEGHKTTIIDNISTGNPENLRSVIDRVNLIQADIKNEEVLNKALGNIDYIFHLAANTSVNLSIEKPSWSATQNIIGTIKLLEAAARNDVKRIIFSSTAAVYGDCKQLPVKETIPPAPASSYGLEKATGENYMKLFASLHNIDTVCLRYFNVFGPRQNADSPHPGGVTIVINQIRDTQCSQLFAEGKQTRDMIYVENVVNANLLAMKRQSAFGGAAFNISTGKSIEIADMHKKIAAIMNTEPKFEHLPFPAGNIIHSCGDNSLAKKELGFKITVDLEEGLDRTIKWSRKLPHR